MIIAHEISNHSAQGFAKHSVSKIVDNRGLCICQREEGVIPSAMMMMMMMMMAGANPTAGGWVGGNFLKDFPSEGTSGQPPGTRAPSGGTGGAAAAAAAAAADLDRASAGGSQSAREGVPGDVAWRWRA